LATVPPLFKPLVDLLQASNRAIGLRLEAPSRFRQVLRICPDHAHVIVKVVGQVRAGGKETVVSFAEAARVIVINGFDLFAAIAEQERRDSVPPIAVGEIEDITVRLLGMCEAGQGVSLAAGVRRPLTNSHLTNRRLLALVVAAQLTLFAHQVV
jgi:hypothetical protein